MYIYFNRYLNKIIMQEVHCGVLGIWGTIVEWEPKHAATYVDRTTLGCGCQGAGAPDHGGVTSEPPLFPVLSCNYEHIPCGKETFS